MFISGDGSQQERAYRRPYLSSDGVLVIAVKGFDSEVLLDPFEKKFHLPAQTVQFSDGQGWQREVVCQKNKLLASLWMIEFDAAQHIRVRTSAVLYCKADVLVANQAGFSVYRHGVHAREL